MPDPAEETNLSASSQASAALKREGYQPQSEPKRRRLTRKSASPPRQTQEQQAAVPFGRSADLLTTHSQAARSPKGKDLSHLSSGRVDSLRAAWEARRRDRARAAPY